jgi:hypothetical protein
MPKLIPTFLVVLCLIMPHPGRAQQMLGSASDRPASDRLVSDRGDEILGLSKENVFAIGAGVVVGALVLHLVVPADFTYFAGGVLGGFAANWWYRNGGESRVRALLKQSNGQPMATLPPAPTTRSIALRQ